MRVEEARELLAATKKAREVEYLPKTKDKKIASEAILNLRKKAFREIEEACSQGSSYTYVDTEERELGEVVRDELIEKGFSVGSVVTTGYVSPQTGDYEQTGYTFRVEW